MMCKLENQNTKVHISIGGQGGFLREGAPHLAAGPRANPRSPHLPPHRPRVSLVRLPMWAAFRRPIGALGRGA
jgi:hypothetical protein